MPSGLHPSSLWALPLLWGKLTTAISKDMLSEGTALGTPAAVRQKLLCKHSPFRPQGRASQTHWESSLTSWFAAAGPGGRQNRSGPAGAGLAATVGVGVGGGTFVCTWFPQD